MIIRAIQNSKLNSGTKLTYTSRRDNKGEYPREYTNTMPIKAIPVIALIAMSPLTNVQKAHAENRISPSNNIEMVSPPANNEVVIESRDFQDNNFGKVTKSLRSTDGNKKKKKKVVFSRLIKRIKGITNSDF